MLLSIALILLVGMTLGWICKKCKLPSLLGMLAAGILLGPYVLDLIDGSILAISSEIRKIALIIILTRAGLSLDISGIKKIGRPAVMMCFIPASFELIGMILFAPKLLGLTMLEAAIMGAVLAAVSSAVVVPRMVKLMEEGYGTKQGIPVCSGGCYHQHQLAGKCRGQSTARDRRRIGSLDAWRFCLPFGNEFKREGTGLFYDGIYTEGNRSGSYRGNSVKPWTCMWRYGADGSCACHCTDSSSWGLCD